jgi:hypothetical protein
MAENGPKNDENGPKMAENGAKIGRNARENWFAEPKCFNEACLVAKNGYVAVFDGFLYRKCGFYLEKVLFCE